MRKTGKTVVCGSDVRMSPDAATRALKRALRLAAVALGIGLVMSAGAARAEDDEDDDTPFEQKIIRNVMTGIGGTNMENRGIDYRERSPLVVPPKIDLPRPDAGAQIKAPNWPKDPELAARKTAASRVSRPEEVLENNRSLTPAEMAPKRARTTAGGNYDHPGDPTKNIVLSPSQLGYEGGLFKNMFGSNKGETAPFPGEPTRGDLTQPPSGYQTPSPNYAYGTGPKEVMKNSGTNENIMSGKY